ncbi:MAG: glycosyltransferase family 2 protein [Bacteroidales bacterium]|nr:glycosyltransferase family 2 protein [Bacteroidales bacterium]MBN2757954.1 glycosyltransferase family 2 protein [Bacteroidales bacterium]
MKFSVIIPIYKCSNSLKELTERLTSTLSILSDNFEIIYVNDASPDNDWRIIVELSKKDKRIKGINLLRYFGQHNAIFLGLKYAKGDWIIVMDGDLQDLPEEIIKLYKKTEEDYDIVFAKRVNRKDKVLKKLFSKLFFKLLYFISNISHDYQIGNFGIYRKEVITSILKTKDNIIIFPILLHKSSFNKTTIDINHGARLEGKSSYNYKKLFIHAFEIFFTTNKYIILLGKYKKNEKTLCTIKNTTDNLNS